MGRPEPSAPPSDWAPPSGPPVDVRPPAPGDHPAGPSGTSTQGHAPDPAAVRRAGRLIGRFALLVLASLLCSGLRLPWQAAAILFSVPAVVVGALAVRAVVRARMRGSTVAFTVVGVAMAALMALGQAALLVFWPLQRELQDCEEAALTRSAQRQCQQDYERRVDDLSRFPSRLS